MSVTPIKTCADCDAPILQDSNRCIRCAVAARRGARNREALCDRCACGARKPKEREACSACLDKRTRERRP